MIDFLKSLWEVELYTFMGGHLLKSIILLSLVYSQGCNPPHHLFPEHCHLPRKKLQPTSPHPPDSLSFRLWQPLTYICLLDSFILLSVSYKWADTMCGLLVFCCSLAQFSFHMFIQVVKGNWGTSLWLRTISLYWFTTSSFVADIFAVSTFGCCEHFESGHNLLFFPLVLLSFGVYILRSKISGLCGCVLLS